MNYQPYLISNFATGLDAELQPWLLPNDAFTDLFDGFVYRGVTTKRDGYSGFATGLGNAYTESRMVHNITAEAYGVGDGTAGPYTYTATNIPLTRGGITITAGAQSATDNGLGVFVTTPAGGTGTVDYTTGDMSITFNAVVPIATPITVTYNYHPGLPVMGVMNFYPTNNVRELIVADTRYVNRFNRLTNRLDDLAAGTYSGGATDFWSWVNYEDASSAPRLLFANGVIGDVIQVYDGSTVADYAPTFTIGTLNARQLFNARDRLVLFQTIENGVFYPRRIRISGTGVNCDNFDNVAPGAGFIDIPDNTHFFGAAFNRDDMLFFTEAATWMLKYTGNDVTPFILEKIDGSRGSSAAFSVISYLNRTMAASPRGLIMSDGYQVDRMDNNIPDFSFNNIDGNNFLRCFSGFLDEDRDVYLIYPSQGEVKPSLLTGGESDRILTINFEEDNYAIYKIPLSCMGNFQTTKTLLWSDLTAENGFPDWESLGAQFSNWNAFPFSKGEPIAIGGGHKGEVWKLNDDESEDNPQMIRDITIIDGDFLEITTDWNNYSIGDYIFFTDVEGMTQLNGKQAAIVSTSTPYTTFVVAIKTLDFDAYTSGGIASKTIQFECTSKKLNPYIDSDKKVRCGWMYFYVSTADTLLTDSDGVEVPASLEVEVITNDREYPTQTAFKYLIDCSDPSNTVGSKKWMKIWINQTAKFVQFKMKNNQAGAKIQVHAIMPGFMSTGRLV